MLSRRLVIYEEMRSNAERAATADVEKDDPIYHLKMTLRGVRPTTWRCVEVPGSMTLRDLHYTIQIVMGWRELHLYEFRVHDKSYAQPQFQPHTESCYRTLIDIFPVLPTRQGFRQVEKGALSYLYDLGDRWVHDIRVEKVTRPNRRHRYPRCVDGLRAAPPEGCGGPLHYRRYLDSLADEPRALFDPAVANAHLRYEFRRPGEKVDLHPPPAATPKPPKKKPKAPKRRASKTPEDRTLPEPFETMVRAREGRATPQQEVLAYRHAIDLYDTLFRHVRGKMERATSAKSRATLAAEGTRVLDFCERMQERIEDLEDEHGVVPEEPW